ncbi:MAG: ammonium transporter [bacterium]|nr:ammonium transporter [bacterium]
MRRRVFLIGSLVAVFSAGPLVGVAAAQTVEEVATAANEIWLVLAATLVMFMQAGFALVEAGFTRSKNSANIIMKNLIDFSVGGLMYWAIGFALAYGGSSVGGWFAWGDVFFFDDPARASEWYFQVVFAATAATIVSGAVAGRVKFVSYLIYTPFITGLIYPIVTHWVWDSRGWLNKLGYVDFAGSGVVHMLGGVAALAGVMVIGPRIGKYDAKGKPQVIAGHSLTRGALGVFILWFGWYGFNAGSTLAAVGEDIAYPAVTTTLAACAGSLGALAVAWLITKRPDPGFALNGVLAGLVGITAGTAAVSFSAAVLIGLLAGALMVGSVLFFERIGIDDPVGAISVHGVAGLWGVIAVGIFAAGDGVTLTNQIIGAGAIVAWTFGTSWIVFRIVDRLVGIRVAPEEEIGGLDRSEHGMDAYPEFVFQHQLMESNGNGAKVDVRA